MDIIFVLIAVCPAVIVTRYELKGEVSWQKFIARFAGWFYGITFANLLLLYLRGWGGFEFNALSVQFLVKYELSSAIVVITVKTIQKLFKKDRSGSNV